jgi:hypothetical protein
MCRNIRTLHHFEPPASEDEVRASALQYVRKLSGMRDPSAANRPAFDDAVEQVAAVTRTLLAALTASGPPRTREAERRKAIERGVKREEALRTRLLAR